MATGNYITFVHLWKTTTWLTFFYAFRQCCVLTHIWKTFYLYRSAQSSTENRMIYFYFIFLIPQRIRRRRETLRRLEPFHSCCLISQKRLIFVIFFFPPCRVNEFVIFFWEKNQLWVAWFAWLLSNTLECARRTILHEDFAKIVSIPLDSPVYPLHIVLS